MWEASPDAEKVKVRRPFPQINGYRYRVVKKKIIIKNKLGIHARPAAMLVETARRYKSEIRLVKDEIEIDAKDILSVMMLGADKGSSIEVKVQGNDETEALESIYSLIEKGFDEE